MAKSSRGGKTSYEKQDQIYNQFQRIIRKAEFEKRNPHYAEETQVEKITYIAVVYAHSKLTLLSYK